MSRRGVPKPRGMTGIPAKTSPPYGCGAWSSWAGPTSPCSNCFNAAAAASASASASSAATSAASAAAIAAACTSSLDLFFTGTAECTSLDLPRLRSSFASGFMAPMSSFDLPLANSFDLPLANSFDLPLTSAASSFVLPRAKEISDLLDLPRAREPISSFHLLRPWPDPRPASSRSFWKTVIVKFSVWAAALANLCSRSSSPESAPASSSAASSFLSPSANARRRVLLMLLMMASLFRSFCNASLSTSTASQSKTLAPRSAR
mmetsp:Transcript_122401/g.290961  ORF Transcript_122401/g.290961 Transcript_122401/m.290961 type:complete len:262 (+) Transcript_122401:78-863(+)